MWLSAAGLPRDFGRTRAAARKGHTLVDIAMANVFTYTLEADDDSREGGHDDGRERIGEDDGDDHHDGGHGSFSSLCTAASANIPAPVAVMCDVWSLRSCNRSKTAAPRAQACGRLRTKQSEFPR